jgi:hypothetical protein
VLTVAFDRHLVALCSNGSWKQQYEYTNQEYDNQSTCARPHRSAPRLALAGSFDARGLLCNSPFARTRWWR